MRKLDRLRATWERDFERWTMLVNRVKNGLLLTHSLTHAYLLTCLLNRDSKLYK